MSLCCLLTNLGVWRGELVLSKVVSILQPPNLAEDLPGRPRRLHGCSGFKMYDAWFWALFLRSWGSNLVVFPASYRLCDFVRIRTLYFNSL